ncbi:MATE family efflux transporter [Anaerocolumna cellulosilytica]|uniref:Probable multidrug resistance protein NorM n=2 Tax=Anaerocolumna cellulosilytica TaxID=433286 RepID=A0A6S6R2A1_9FIRM|nr:putative MATE family efflux protein [Anaerocolumna cellulosilytica]BCJ93311.1 MATE family efflux transporter [Anaerocolumna cellulosilytica]
MSDTIATLKENKMGTMPVPKLLISMSLPMVISMLVQALYNVVDSIFVSQINEKAFTALSLAFPIQNLMIAVSVGTGIGINALLSRSLGERKYKEANMAAVNGLFLSVISSILFALFGIFFSRAFFEIQTDDLEIIQYGTEYLSTCTIFSFGIFFQITLERLMQSTGRTFYNMLTQTLGAVINIVLDPILIFGLLGFPQLGVLGAAIATIAGQIIAMTFSFYFNIKKNKEITLTLKGFKPHKKTISTILMVGIPSIIMQSIGSLMVFGMNKILIVFTPTAVSVFGAYFKLQSFIFMPVFGITNGMIPIIAYNYGAGNKKRIVDTIKLSVVLATGIMFAGLLLFQTAPATLLGFFHASDEMLTLGIPALRIISISFILAGYCIVLSSVFQALGNGLHSMFISIARQLVVILPVAFLLSKTLGMQAVWFCFPLAETLAVVLCTYFMKRNYDRKISILTPLSEESSLSA